MGKFGIVIISAVIGFGAGSLDAQSGPSPPLARKTPKVAPPHGNIRVDNYFWLREKTNPEVIRYLEAENGYTEAGLKHLEPLREALYQELLGRIKETDQAVPYYE